MADNKSNSSEDDIGSDADLENEDIATEEEDETTLNNDEHDTSFDYTTLAATLLNKGNPTL